MSRPADLAGVLALMQPVDESILSWLARCPFLGTADLATLMATREPSSAYRRLRALRQRGLVDHVVPSSKALHPQRLFYLTDLGVRSAAHVAGEPASAFAHRLDIGEAGLLRRLTRLEHLVHARGVLIDLLAVLGDTDHTGSGTECHAHMEAWQPWPVRLSYTWRGRRLSVTVDGAGTLVVRRGGKTRAAPFVLVWDDDALPLCALRPRLRALLRARDAPERWSGSAPPFPAVLLVGASEERAEEARRLALNIAHEEGVRALLLLTTSVSQLWEADPLAPIWCDEGSPEGALLTTVPFYEHRVVERGPVTDPSRRTGQQHPARRRVLVRGDFAARARSRAGNPAGVSLLSLGLLSPDVVALHWIATQPLLTAAHLAELARASARGTANTLRRLERRGLVAWDLPERHELPHLRRYFLTPDGLRFLAQRAGLAPTDYARSTGSIAGLLVARPSGEGHRDRPFPRKGILSGQRLAWLQRYLPHTCAVQELFLGFVRAARAARADGASHALEVWQGDWACARRYTDDGVCHTLRPDALGCYRIYDEALTFFVEIDRGTCTLRRDLGAKLTAYVAYRDSGAWAHGRRATSVFPTLLVVTTAEGRLRHLLELAGEVAAARLSRPLPLLVATAEDLAAEGPLGPIWRSAVQAPPRHLSSVCDGSMRARAAVRR